MVEPILHFAVPFVSLRAAELDWRSTIFACLVALIPDLDVIFGVHRSQSHSFFVIAAVAIPVLVATRKRPTLRTFTLVGTFAVLTHLVLDFFQLAIDSTPTPSFWPFFSAQLITSENPTYALDEPVLTVPGLVISLMLMTPGLVPALRNRLASAERTASGPST